MIGLLSSSAEPPPPPRPPPAAQLTAESDNGLNRVAVICSVELRSVAEDHGYLQVRAKAEPSEELKDNKTAQRKTDCAYQQMLCSDLWPHPQTSSDLWPRPQTSLALPSDLL